MEKIFAADNLCNPALPPALGGCGSGIDKGGSILGNLISSLVGLTFILGFCLALAYLLTGGIQWIASNGDKAQLEASRNKITHAIIGLIILAAAYAIFKLIGNFFGIDLPNIKIPTVTGV